ncbi:MAG: enoyl-CoA hydratase/isomerase family protein [Phycisphaerales bacterium]|nr:enoyl-CoA hydratase/isomerase family protein [Phycisphaerales bacterium]
MSNDLAQLAIDAPVARLTLNRADKRNALSLDLLGALHTRLDELEARDDVSALVLGGAGPSFCAGMDLKAVLKEPGAPLKLLSSIAELTIRLRSYPAVVIGRIQGAAIGGGCGLVACCDIAATHPDAKLGYPEVDLGVCPAVVAPWLVSSIGSGRARRVLLSGGVMSGLEAYELGLVSSCVPKEDLDAHIEERAALLAKAGPRALSETKRLLNEIEGERIRELVRKGAHISADVVAGEEAQARLAKVYGG